MAMLIPDPRTPGVDNVPGGEKVRVSRDILGAIGNTPIVELHKLAGKDHARILLKLESAHDAEPAPTPTHRESFAIARESFDRLHGELQPLMSHRPSRIAKKARCCGRAVDAGRGAPAP